jgi:hypothetical protein
MPKIFLSHSSKDKAFTRKLASRLADYDIEFWLDEAEINVGDSLMIRISSAIEETDFIAVVLSHESVNSHWVQVELQMAMNRELSDKQVRVLPILIEKCEIPMFLRDKLYADFTDPQSFNAPFAQILRALGVEKSLEEVSKPTLSTPVSSPKKTKELPEDLQGFVDILIIGVDKGRTYNPDPQKALYNVYFELSTYPPQEWADIFEAERRFPRHTMWRKAWVDGLHIVVYCVPDEVKQYHLRDIKEDVETSNQKYRDFLHREATRNAQKIAREEKELSVLDTALDDLDI